MTSPPTILIVEDGDEYLENLSQFAPGPRYLQAHSGAQALALLRAHEVALIYLDMRFDRIPDADLLGDRDAAARSQGGDATRTVRYLARNQGLYILEAIREGGFAHLPVILAYDFTSEPRRFAHLSRVHPTLTWVPDAITPDEIRSRLARLLGSGALSGSAD